jgi:DNA-binding transcriptional MerR regulator
MDAYTIKDLENLTGIKAHTIRIWEQRYHFLTPQRTATNIRYYTGSELKTLLNIALLNKYGYKISHIDRMQPAEIREKVLSLSQDEAKVERIITEMIQHMIDMDADAFEVTLDKHIQLKGVEKTIQQIIFPFLEKIGLLWLTNHINPAQEHVVTNIIRQKIMIGIETIRPAISANKLVVLFLPDGEHHELGLLFMYYMLKNRGYKVMYLGASVPLRDMQYVVARKSPHLLFTHLTSVAGNFNLERFLNNVHIQLPQVPMVVSGQLAASYKKKLPASIHIGKSLPEVLDLISEL